jgi:hypothetical protein
MTPPPGLGVQTRGNELTGFSSTVNDFGIRPTTVTAMRRSEACTASERMTPLVPEPAGLGRASGEALRN